MIPQLVQRLSRASRRCCHARTLPGFSPFRTVLLTLAGWVRACTARGNDLPPKKWTLQTARNARGCLHRETAATNVHKGVEGGRGPADQRNREHPPRAQESHHLDGGGAVVAYRSRFRGVLQRASSSAAPRWKLSGRALREAEGRSDRNAGARRTASRVFPNSQGRQLAKGCVLLEEDVLAPWARSRGFSCKRSINRLSGRARSLSERQPSLPSLAIPRIGLVTPHPIGAAFYLPQC